jgi:hypothetical protein
MVRLFDGTFLLGTLVVGVTVAIAVMALTADSLPIIGTGRAALIAVAVVGMTACAIGGISQAPSLGWTSPGIVIGVVFGVAALIVLGAGLFGWDGLLQPVAQFVPTRAAIGTLTERTAIVALAAIVVTKWVVGVAMAALARAD